MIRFIKGTIMVVAGLCWIAFAALICVLLFQYLGGGAGLQVFGFFFSVSSPTVLVGLVHFVGFAAAACLCLAIGVGLFAYGVTSPQERRHQTHRDEMDDV